MNINAPETRPYVVSADVHGLMRNWADEQGILIPDVEYFDGFLSRLTDNLSAAFNYEVEIDVVPSDYLKVGLNDIIEGIDTPIISLDRAYIDAEQVDGFIDMTRAVDTRFNSIGIHERPEHPSLDQQLSSLGTEFSGQKITLVDDVTFTGEGALELIGLLNKQNIEIETFVNGIGIGEGVDLLRKAGVRVENVRFYDDVVDEICERDFLAGVPMSGRTVVSENGDSWSAPYFKPFGRPEIWASIPVDTADRFSGFCLNESIKLWSQVGKMNGITITPNDVPRQLGSYYFNDPTESLPHRLLDLKIAREL